MRTETQRDILRRFFELRERRTTTMAPAVRHQPAAVYTDPARLDAETQALFRGRPLVVALAGDLPATGTYLATEAAGVPLLIVRGEDGCVRGFLNVCRHRGGRVATGRGCPGRAFKCPYHSWAYDLDGALLGQPVAREAFAELDKAEYGLVPIPVAERFGLILARPGGAEPIDVESELGPELAADIAAFDFGSFRLCEERSGVFDANWKLIHDTFTESYHIFSLHRNTLAPDMLSTPFVVDFFGAHARAAVMRREVGELLERPEEEWSLRANASIVYLLFPSAVINLPMSGHAELWEIYPEPGDPHRTRVTMKFYIPREPASDAERRFWQTNVEFTAKVVFEEDFDQQQDIHRSLRSGLVGEVVYGRNEPGLIHHHDQVEAALLASEVAPAG